MRFITQAATNRIEFQLDQDQFMHFALDLRVMSKTCEEFDSSACRGCCCCCLVHTCGYGGGLAVTGTGRPIVTTGWSSTTKGLVRWTELLQRKGEKRHA
jgi:hypothetical protein